MRSGTSSCAVALVVAMSAGAACGDEELFAPQLASGERLLDAVAAARLAKADETISELAVVGDLDGDGIDDAILRTKYLFDEPGGPGLGGNVYIVYGGTAASGSVDLASAPVLTGIGYGPWGVSRVGDFDGDGLADFLISEWSDCRSIVPPPEPDGHSGAYLVYGSATRFAGATPIADASVFLRDARQCTFANELVDLRDLDADGKADFAIVSSTGEPGVVELFVYYGRSPRLSGSLDLQTSADAVLRSSAGKPNGNPRMAPAGDVDGDGYSDFLVDAPLTTERDELGLVRGAATRLSGVVALADVVHTRFVDSEPGSPFGRFGAALGDVDGDGRDDFTVGDGQSNGWFPRRGFSQVHHVFHGRDGGFPSELRLQDADAVLTSTIGAFGLATADLDGDGFRELVVGDPRAQDHNGAVHVIPGDGARLASGDPTSRGIAYVGRTVREEPCEKQPRSACGRVELVGSEVHIGDLTGDGLADVLVAAPIARQIPPSLGMPETWTGRAYVLSLPASTKP
jgi:hypothetical protein